MDDGENTPRKTAALKPAWQPGQSGNPNGRPKGARNRFAERFIDDFMNDWEANGADTIAKVRSEKPDVYLRTAAAILPKQFDVNIDDIDSLSADDIDRRLAAVEARAAALASGEGGTAGAGAGAGQPSRIH